MAVTTVGEANAASTLIRLAIGQPGISDDRALSALLLLQASVRAKLLAGPMEDEVRRGFAELVARRDLDGPSPLDGAMYLLAHDHKAWQRATEPLPMAQREAMADAAYRYEAAAVDDSEERLGSIVRWWR